MCVQNLKVEVGLIIEITSHKLACLCCGVYHTLTQLAMLWRVKAFICWRVILGYDFNLLVVLIKRIRKALDLTFPTVHTVKTYNQQRNASNIILKKYAYFQFHT